MKNQNRIVLLLISVLALAGIAYIVAAGFDQDQYLEVVEGGRGPKGYPLQGVATFAAIATAESLIFLVILRPNSYRKSWRRALLALTASVAFISPTYYGYFFPQAQCFCCSWFPLLRLGPMPPSSTECEQYISS